jgi:hypothetical protein
MPHYLSMSHCVRVGVLVLAAGLLLGCGDSGEPDAPKHHTAKARQAQQAKAAPKADPRSEVDAATKHMVAAVNTDAPAPLGVKFELKSVPRVGQPLKIDVALVPELASSLLEASFEVGPGLQLPAGLAPAQFSEVKPITLYRYELTVTPTAAGVSYVNAQIKLNLPTGTKAAMFSIPVLVQAG